MPNIQNLSIQALSTLLLIISTTHSFALLAKDDPAPVLTERILETAPCSQGCLQCDTSTGQQTCKICDLQQGYFPISKSCQRIEIPNCLFYSDYGRCAQCAENHYLSRSKQCFQLTSPIPDCLYYASPFKCTVCLSGKVISSDGSQCVELQAKLRGCEIYKNQNSCLKCQQGYVLNPITNECSLVTEQANCKLYSSAFECESCLSDFTLLRSYYLQHMELHYNDIASAIYLSDANLQDPSINLPFCKWTYQISNCFKYDAHGKCIECLEGYYLELDEIQKNLTALGKEFVSLDVASLEIPENTESNEYTTLYEKHLSRYLKVLNSDLIGSQCKLNPKTKTTTNSSIPNCSQPDKNRCNLCFNNYYLDSNLYCQPHDARLENCFLMSQKFKNSCLVCQPGYFLQVSPSNINSYLCHQRTNKYIEFCIDYALNKDTCSECKVPKVLHNNGLTCSDPISFCKTHSLSDATLTCSTCDTNYAYNSITNQCELEDDNCIFRAVDGNCLMCKEGFYLNNALTCVQSDAFDLNAKKCKTSKIVDVEDSLSQNKNHLTCIDCNSGFFRKLFINQCVQGGPLPVANCRTYDSSNDCLECAAGHYLHSNSTCQPGSITGCQHYSSQTVCKTCLQNYLLVSGQCLSFSNSEIENGLNSDSISCMKWTISNNKIQCDVCEPNHVVKREINEIVFTECIQDGTETPTIPNCMSEDKSIQENNGGNVKCAECQVDFYKNSGDLALGLGTSCSPSCGVGEMPDSVLKTCQTKISQFPISNCSHGNGRSLCYQCDSGYKAKYNLNFFHQSLYLWTADHPSGPDDSTQVEKFEPFIEECISNNDNDVEYFFEVQSNSFEYVRYNTLTTINGVQKTIPIKNCDQSSSVVFEEGDLNFALSCHKCSFDAFKRMMLTVVPVDLVLNDVPFLDDSLLEFESQTPDLSTSKMPFLSCHTSLMLNDDESATNHDLRFCYVQFYDVFHERFICKVCSPGYKSCQKISNCDTALTPGICDKCKTNYVFSSFHPDMQTQEFTNQTRNSQINRTECVYFGNNQTNVLAVDSLDHSIPVACTSKSTLDFLTNTCMPLISDEGDAQKNCKGYSNENCLECKSGYWMKFLHKQIEKCSLANDLSLRQSGCAVFNNSVFNDPSTAFAGTIECLECYSGFVLNVGDSTCVNVRSVLNCQEYNITDLNNLRCNVCLPGYELDGSFKCVIKTSSRPEDTIPNCIFLDDDFNCVTCKNDYFLVSEFDYSLQRSTTICQKIALPENCELIDTTLLKDQGKVFCKRCKDGFAPDLHSSPEILSSCQKTIGIDNCLIRQGKSCIECSLDYFLNSQKECQLRSQLSSTCLEYHKTQDSCSKFFTIDSPNVEETDAEVVSAKIFIGLENAALFDVVKDLPVLVNLPQNEDPENLVEYEGIDFCEKYLTPSRCLVCKNRYFLNILTNKCQPVTQTISNCLFYSDSSTCFQCDKDFMLINNSCFQQTNFTCLVNENESSCLSCPPERPILDANKTCVAPESVPDCLAFTINSSTGGYECTQCEEFFYLNSGKCDPIVQEIDKCQYYSAENECQRCLPGYFYNSVTGSCETAVLFEGNCLDYRSGSQCMVCEPGFFMDEKGTCLRCEALNCGFCDPHDLNKCLVCISGYYMDTSGNCVL